MVIGTIETLAKQSEVTKWWFFRTTDTWVKLNANLKLPKDFGQPREKLSKSQRALVDYDIKLRGKVKRILKEYLTGDRLSVVLKVKAL
jgi:dipeptidase